MTDYGMSSLLPTLVVVVTAVVLKRALEALVLGSLVGFYMLSGSLFVTEFLDGTLRSMGNETVRWIVLTVALFGSIVHLLIQSGGASAFAASVARWVKNGPQALLVTWGLGLVIFIDDYLNALAVGSSMRKVVDRLKISRQMLAYVVDTTAAPVCILMPFSTWAIYVAGLLEDNQVAVTGEGLSAYIEAIPFMVYAWIALIMPPLVALGKLPLLGSMKTFEAHAQRAGDEEHRDLATRTGQPAGDNEAGERRLINFFVPMLSLILFTWMFDIDVLKGAFAALVVTLILYRAQGTMSLFELFDHSVEGVKSMVEVIAILIMSFVLKDVNDQLQLTSYMIDVATRFVNPQLLPVITFLTLSLIAFATGTFWGLYAVALPIVLPMAASLEVNTTLIVGAVISAGAFGSHTCFYSDSTILSAKGSGCAPMEHALSQLPYALIAAGLTAIVFLLLPLWV